jgi:hypothetical protein
MLTLLTPIISATSGADRPRLTRALRKSRAKFERRGNALTSSDVTTDEMVAASPMNKDQEFEPL